MANKMITNPSVFPRTFPHSPIPFSLSFFFSAYTCREKLEWLRLSSNFASLLNKGAAERRRISSLTLHPTQNQCK